MSSKGWMKVLHIIYIKLFFQKRECTVLKLGALPFQKKGEVVCEALSFFRFSSAIVDPGTPKFQIGQKQSEFVRCSLKISNYWYFCFSLHFCYNTIINWHVFNAPELIKKCICSTVNQEECHMFNSTKNLTYYENMFVSVTKTFYVF